MKVQKKFDRKLCLSKLQPLSISVAVWHCKTKVLQKIKNIQKPALHYLHYDSENDRSGVFRALSNI